MHRKHASLQEIAWHLKQSQECTQDLLEYWMRKGCVQCVPTHCTLCHRHCHETCGSSARMNVSNVIYQWND